VSFVCVVINGQQRCHCFRDVSIKRICRRVKVQTDHLSGWGWVIMRQVTINGDIFAQNHGRQKCWLSHHLNKNLPSK